MGRPPQNLAATLATRTTLSATPEPPTLAARVAVISHSALWGAIALIGIAAIGMIANHLGWLPKPLATYGRPTLIVALLLFAIAEGANHVQRALGGLRLRWSRLAIAATLVGAALGKPLGAVVPAFAMTDPNDWFGAACLLLLAGGGADLRAEWRRRAMPPLARLGLCCGISSLALFSALMFGYDTISYPIWAPMFAAASVLAAGSAAIYFRLR